MREQPSLRRFLRLCVVALGLGGGAISAATSHAAVYDPALRWRTLETAHFHIHYAEGLELEARRIAEVGERVHTPMVEALGWAPTAATEVTIVDKIDLANGYATVLPYNQIVLYPVRPSFFEELGDYNGWLETVFIHEYAHILGLDAVRGYSAILRKIFGRMYVPATPLGALLWFVAAPPNAFLPPWFHEGLAVNMESDLTGRGRKGSTFYDMIYRADVASDTVPPLDRLGGDFPGWPSFSTRYIYGARLLQTVEEDFGKQALRNLVVGHAGRFPFAINAPPEEATGKTYAGLHRRMKTDLEARYGPEIRRLRGEGLTPVQELAESIRSESAPLWLDADTVVCTRKDGIHPTVLVAKRVGDGRSTVLADRPGGESRPTRLADGRIAFARVEVSKPLAGGLVYSDLYAVSPTGEWLTRLTSSARLLEADFSNVTGSFVGVQAKASGRKLVLVTLVNGEPTFRTLLAEEGVRYDHPRWSPDSRQVAFSRKTETGQARLALLDLASGAVRLLTPEGFQAGFPAWSPDGRQVAFSSDRTGVYDLYAYEVATGGVRRLTRLLGGAFEPDWSPDGRRIAFTSYTAKGFSIALLSLSDCLSEEIALPPPETLAVAAVPARPTPIAESKPYSPLPRALPTFWLPDLLSDNRGVAPGVWTAGTDPLGRHLYYLSAFWSGKRHSPYGFVSYRNDVWYPTFTLRAGKLPVVHTNLLDGGNRSYDYWEEDRFVGLQARFRLPRALRAFSLAVEWAWEEVARLSSTSDDLDGRIDLADVPFRGRLNPLTVSLLYDSAFPHDNRFTVGAEAGRRLELTYRLRNEALGADINLQDVVGEWREYLPLPFLAQTTAALRAKGGISRGRAPFQSVYQVGGEGGEFPVRGYPLRVDRGSRAALGSAEVRFPLWSPYRGVSDWPLFLGRIHGAAVFDAAKAWEGGDGEWRRSAGTEVRVDTVLGYYLPTTLVLGLAQGVDEGGQTRGYLTFTGVY